MRQLWVKYRIQPDHVNRGQTEALRSASRSEVVAWLREQGAIDIEAATVALIGLAKNADLYPTHSDNWRKRAEGIVDAALPGEV